MGRFGSDSCVIRHRPYRRWQDRGALRSRRAANRRRHPPRNGGAREIARCWTEATQESRVSFVYQNLAALWSNFAAVGATRLLLSGLVGHRQEVERVSHAVPGALVTIARLHAPLAVLEQRIRRREAASPDGELDGARWWTRHFEAEHPEDYLVETHERPVREIAVDVLRRAGWLTEPGRQAPSALSASRLSARRSDQPQ
jgi:hypothetical protein